MATILVIDDSPSMIAFLESNLKRVGHEVTTACNGSEGLKHMHSRRFDLVITDLYMPEVDGIETICRARKANLLGRLIAISSRDSVVNLLSIARALGATRSLQKPFTAEQIIEAVTAVLRLPDSVLQPKQSGPRSQKPTPSKSELNAPRP
jgi:DNA-binding response OmpR family regulator